MRPALVGILVVASAGCSHGTSQRETAAEASGVDAPSLEASISDAGAGTELQDAIAEAQVADTSVPPPKHYRVVVHTGDSMVGGGLCKALAPKFKAEGTQFVRDVWESASLMAFADSDRLPKLMKKYDPDLVLLTLGANDVFDKHPENMIRYIDLIVKKVGKRDCYWIGPPLWKGDFGLTDTIREHAAPCTFYDSRNLTLQRAGDGIHPTEKGGATWADAFWDFFEHPVAAGGSPTVVRGD
jgi:lysophospholipase L1-like esterase